MTSAPARGVVGLLTAQALAFGVTLALLVIPANALFLDAYGSEWLPATYIATAVVGSVASIFIARAARHTRLVRLATVTLGALAVVYAASWVILVAGGVWVSAVLLVAFPIALQLGFVFIGGQAGRLLDVRQMKERFPRIVSGFAVGFFLGGLLGIPLLSLLGSTEQLMLATTAADIAFLGLLIATERRFPEIREAPAGEGPVVARPPLRTLFAPGIVLLLLIYQILSAMGSQVFDFLLFDRASTQYSGDELTKFLSAYTAVLNLVDILFLAILAGPLMRRFGLRVGLVLNPAVVSIVLAVMTVIATGGSSAAFALFVLAAALRVADIAATDGTTRTSINAAFQVVPIGERLAVQAVVEGVGVPVAIGVTGVILLALNFLDLGIGAVIVFGLALSVIWTGIAVGVYRSYRRTLAAQMRRRSLLAGAVGFAENEAALRELLQSSDVRDVRLGLDLLAGVESDASGADLQLLADHADPGVRVRALAELASRGDSDAAAEVAPLVARLAGSSEPSDRRAAAMAMGARGVVADDRAVLTGLLADPDRTVRAAALDAVMPEDGADERVIRHVVAAVGEPRTAGPATDALKRLGEPAIPFLVTALARDRGPRRPCLVRAAAVAAATHGVTIIAPALRDPDRDVVLVALEALDAAGGSDVVLPVILDDIFRDAAAQAARAQAARAAIEPADGPLQRALDDELELARRLVIAVLALRHGDRVREAVRVADFADGQRRALGVEALEVILSREEAEVVLPLVRRETRKGASLRAAEIGRSREQWVADIVADPDGVWRSSWLAACARHAAAQAGDPG